MILHKFGKPNRGSVVFQYRILLLTTSAGEIQGRGKVFISQNKIWKAKRTKLNKSLGISLPSTTK